MWMEGVPSSLGQDWWNETISTDGHEFEKPFAIIIICLKATWSLLYKNVSVEFVFWSLSPVKQVCSKNSKSNGHFPRTLLSLVSEQ